MSGLRKADKEQRIEAANELLTVIASRGIHFFNHTGAVWKGRRGEIHKGHISQFHADSRGHVYLEDGYTGRPCYRRPLFGQSVDGSSLGWFGEGFTQGGTLNQLCQHLHEFIRTGKPQRMNLGPWPDWYCSGDLWGYGSVMEDVRDAARRLGMWDHSQPGCS